MMGRIVTFGVLEERLLEVLREGIRNGVVTERRLARITGVSQPHMHNLMKGARRISPRLADRILYHLKLSVTDLMIDEAVEWGLTQTAGLAEVPMLAAPLGPGLEVPDARVVQGRQQFPISALCQMQEPVMVRLLADPVVGHLYEEDEYALVERAEEVRAAVAPGALCVVSWGGKGLVRWLHAGGKEEETPGEQEWFALPEGADRAQVLSLVWGRVEWIGRNRWYGALDLPLAKGQGWRAAAGEGGTPGEWQAPGTAAERREKAAGTG